MKPIVDAQRDLMREVVRQQREIRRNVMGPWVPEREHREPTAWEEFAVQVPTATISALVDFMWSSFCSQWLIVGLCASPLADVLTESQRSKT